MKEVSALKTNGFAARCLVLLFCAALCLSLAGTAAAVQVGTLTISYPINGTVYHIYSVGRLLNGGIVMNEVFKDVDTSDYAAAAAEMAEMIQKDKVCDELASAKVTNEKAVFTNLPMAVYLVLGEPGEKDGVKYWPTPFLLSVPQKDENSRFVWDVAVTGKKEMSMDISVVKRWVGDQAADRPTKITVHLMRGGKPYGPAVTLSKANQWSHTWENLPPDNWSVTEDANPRYTTVITRQGNTFIVTNTWKKIPQTGQLWWPVSALALAGLIFICAGLLRRRGHDGNA